jgi:putative hydrolase of the HAD superfamily
MNKLHPKAVIFDLGSTLIEYEVVPWEQLNALCASSSRKFLVESGFVVPDEQTYDELFELSKSDYRKTASETLVEWNVTQVTAPFLERIRIEPSVDLIERFFDAYYQPVDSLLYAYSDTVATLDWLRPRCVKIGLISNTVFPERAHRQELDKFGIAPYLDFAIFSSTFKLRKPHPDIFRHACSLAGFEPEECVYVGDRYVEDILGPGGIGMPAILRVKENREYPVDMPSDIRRVSTLSELKDHLDI